MRTLAALFWIYCNEAETGLVPSVQDFDKKLAEADAYLQILIDQLKVGFPYSQFLSGSVDDKGVAQCSFHHMFRSACMKGTSTLSTPISPAVYVLSFLLEMCLQLYRYQKCAMFTINPVDGIYQPPLEPPVVNTTMPTQTTLPTGSGPSGPSSGVASPTHIPLPSHSVPDFSYSSSEDEFYDADEYYQSTTSPKHCAVSILTVPWVELGGECNISCSKSGYSANIVFHTKPFYGGKKHRVTAEIFINKPGLCSRLWRDVTLNLKLKDIDAATEAKHRLEEKQRAEARERKEKEQQWETRVRLSLCVFMAVTNYSCGQNFDANRNALRMVHSQPYTGLILAIIFSPLGSSPVLTCNLLQNVSVYWVASFGIGLRDSRPASKYFSLTRTHRNTHHLSAAILG
ncbi:hypothetical protein GOODEAATRI_003858 [Goodea atripinnis]|uniref:Uncharacterized protein n=1 Tax=Goodea atripinnis TaxID=208336 RepID=A0ABV0MP34_9TELE